LHGPADHRLHRQTLPVQLLHRQKGGQINALRITAGTLRGRRIPVPPHDVRPTSERARQAFFNIVGPRIQGAHFLDLFAGSGVFSFEAVSRGAADATAIDSSKKNVAAIQKVAKEWNVPVKGIVADVLKEVASGQWPVAGEVKLATGHWPPATIVYADPPYDFAQYDALLDVIDRLPLEKDAIIAIEHRRKTNLASETNHLRFLRRAEYGEVWISMYARKESEWN
jgi:16S rRNA (guanine(966)-N(2))-methyltransferase RsmD